MPKLRKIKHMVGISTTIGLTVALLASVALAQVVNVAHTSVNVTTSTTEVVATKSNRGYLLLENDSDETMWCNIGADAVLNEGIRLNAAGGSYEMSRGERNIDRSEVDCIHNGTGNKVMLVTHG